MIDHLYEHYRRTTETDVAASILVLASVLANQQDRFLSVKEAAAVLKCSVDSVYQMCESKTLAHKRVGKGGHIRIRESRRILAWQTLANLCQIFAVSRARFAAAAINLQPDAEWRKCSCGIDSLRTPEMPCPVCGQRRLPPAQ